MRRFALIVGTGAAVAVSVGVALAHDPGDGCSDVHERDTVTIVCNDGDNHFVGTAEHDVVFLHAGNDYGSGGRLGDVIRGHQGADRLRGGDGNDEVYGNNGADSINGGDGADVVNDATDNQFEDRDYLCAGTDDVRDVIRANDGDPLDRIYADAGEDDIHYDIGTDGSHDLRDTKLDARDCPLAD
jgi:hypothetical protein